MSIKKILFSKSRAKLFNIPARYHIEKATILKAKGLFKKKKREKCHGE